LYFDGDFDGENVLFKINFRIATVWFKHADKFWSRFELDGENYQASPV
jgi:hypothetical protein